MSIGREQCRKIGRSNGQRHSDKCFDEYSYRNEGTTSRKIQPWLEEEPALFATLNPTGYKHRPERIMVLTIMAYDWNCPQHIIPGFTAEEIEQVLTSHQLIANLEEDNKRLNAEIDKMKRNDYNASFHL